MICDVDRKRVIRTGAIKQYLYHCTLENGQWEGDVIVETADLAMAQTDVDDFVIENLASQVSAQASEAAASTIVVAPEDIRTTVMRGRIIRLARQITTTVTPFPVTLKALAANSSVSFGFRVVARSAANGSKIWNGETGLERIGAAGATVIGTPVAARVQGAQAWNIGLSGSGNTPVLTLTGGPFEVKWDISLIDPVYNAG